MPAQTEAATTVGFASFLDPEPASWKHDTGESLRLVGQAEMWLPRSGVQLAAAHLCPSDGRTRYWSATHGRLGSLRHAAGRWLPVASASRTDEQP